MLASPDAVPTAVDLSGAGRLAVQVRTVSWRALVLAALTSVLMAVALVQGLAGRSLSVRPVGRIDNAVRGGLSRLPLVAQGQISGAVGADSAVFRVRASGRAFRADNPVQHLSARFGRSGVTVSTGALHLGLTLRAVGYGASLRPYGSVEPRVVANRVSYSRPRASEWYVNGPAGLEQGFTIAKAEGSASAGPLTLSLAASGEARASLAGDGHSVLFHGASGVALRYGGLAASDARGYKLNSWLELRAGRVLVRVDARGARYPLRIDPFIQQGGKLTGSGETGEGWFGYSVALSSDGKTALVGGAFDNSEVGAAWVFTRTGGVWTQQGTKLTGSGEVGKAYFGESIALSADGNTALIGGPRDNAQVGAAWVFTRSEGKWTQQGEKLTGGGEAGSGWFGSGVALSSDGNTALIGGWNDHEGEKEKLGAAWVFTRAAGKWTQQGAKFTGSSESKEASFGWSVALSSDGNTALIGGTGDGSPYTTHHGAAWVFTRSGGSWTQQGSKLTIEEPLEESGEFGFSVALSADGNTALIGAPMDRAISGNAGTVAVFTRSGTSWSKLGNKLSAFGIVEARFGWSVALTADGNTALVGGWGDGSTGSAWVFSRFGSVWAQRGPKLSGSGAGQLKFGYGVALSSDGSTALIGSPGDTERAGAAWPYTFVFSPEEEYGPVNEGEPHRPHCMKAKPVNCATGNEVETQSDLAVGGRGPGLNLTRTYNSQLAATQTTPGPFGYGWTGPYSAHLVINEGIETATVYQDNGSDVVFELTPSKTYVGLSPLVQATLVKEGSTYVYTLPHQTKLGFDVSGRLATETDRNGNAITMSRNAEGRLESVTDGDARKLTFAYNEAGQVESVTDPMGHTVKYTYEAGNLASVTQPAEASLRWQFKYDSSHEMTSETDGRGHTITTEYDERHRVILQSDAMERHRKWAYAITEAGESETTITEPNGSTTAEIFNNAGLPTSVTRAAGTLLAATTTSEYDANYNLIALSDPNKHITKYGYNAAGDKTSAKDANGNETKWTYNATHDLETTTTPGGEKTTIKRDIHGNPEVVERPAPAAKIQKTTYKYNVHGDRISETDPLERTRTYEYDAAGDRETATDAASDKRTWKYNEDSQVISTVSPRGNVKGVEAAKYTTTTERDAQGRPLKITDPLGHTTKYTYDGDGNIETMTDGNLHTTTYTYDADNELLKVEEPNGTITETGYDSEGQISSQTDGNKHTTKYEHNALEQVGEVIDPRERKTVEEYDLVGNLTATVDAAKRTTTYKYDAGNRLIEIKYSDGKTATAKYEYDKEGDRTKMTDGTGSTKYTLDQLDRLTESENGHKEKVKYEYNLGNELVKITYPSTKAVTRAYDKAGRLEKVTDWASHVTKFAYDPDSDLAATTFPSETKNEDKYAYNEADQMSEAKMIKAPEETLASLVYVRDSDGQLKSLTSKGLPGEEKPSYEYDANNRVTKAATTGYEYDTANDPTKVGTATYKYDSANELETGPSTAYAYNEVGQRTKATPTPGVATTYGYDQAGNLNSVERPAEGEKAAIADTYTYDGNNLRASQTISGKASFFAWDTSESLPLLLNDGTNSYIYGPGGLPVEQINSTTGTVLYLHHDQQGATRMLTSSTGKVEGTTTYDAYGNTTGHTGTATTPLGYDGQYTSSDTGLTYLRARSYDPATAEFMSPDPLSGVTRSPYRYAVDNPLNWGDSSGLLSWSDIAQGVGVGAVCLLTDGGCVVAGLADLDANVIANDIKAIIEPCKASAEEIKTLHQLLGAVAGSTISALASLAPEIKAALQQIEGGRLAANQLKGLGVTAGTVSSLIYGENHSSAASGCPCAGP